MPEVFEQATEYIVSALPLDHIDCGTWSVTVEWRGDGDRWVVAMRGRVLNRKGEWEWEPIPSSRTKPFLKRTRFDLQTALKLAREAAPKLRINGMTAADVLAKDARSC